MEFRKNLPFIAKGLEPRRFIFSGGRLCVQMADHGGLTHISSFGQQRLEDVQLYRSGDPLSAWTQIFRLCAVIDDRLFYLKFNATRIYPCGYSSRCTLENVTLGHEMFLLNDAQVYRLRVIRNPRNKQVAAALLHGDLFPLLWDDKVGFFYDSLSARDLAPRKHYAAHAVLWLTPFARDLVAGRENRLCRFMVDHLRVRHEFRLMPPWDTRYMADGNNQGFYSPFVERFYREISTVRL